jgi:mannose-6-phosphate isomerase-like protein (cupin superfamily)
MPARPARVACYAMSVRPLRPRNAELDGYVYLPRMLDKARATLAGAAGTHEFGCPLDHTCMARLGVTPETVLDLVTRHADDAAVLAELRARGIPPAADVRFDAEAVEDELQAGTYLRVRRLEAISELEPRAGDEILAVDRGAARIFLGERQVRVVRAGEAVRVPPSPPHRIESAGEQQLKLRRIDLPGE